MPGTTLLILRPPEPPGPPAQVPSEAPQDAEMLDAGQALLPWVTDLQRGVVELRGVLADIDTKQLQMDVRSP